MYISCSTKFIRRTLFQNAQSQAQALLSVRSHPTEAGNARCARETSCSRLALCPGDEGGEKQERRKKGEREREEEQCCHAANKLETSGGSVTHSGVDTVKQTHPRKNTKKPAGKNRYNSDEYNLEQSTRSYEHAHEQQSDQTPCGKRKRTPTIHTNFQAHRKFR